VTILARILYWRWRSGLLAGPDGEKLAEPGG
jgi:hypothetical protein